MNAKTLWYADGLRWIGSILNDAADNLERTAADSEPLDPRTYRSIDEYVSDLRSRGHML